MTPFQDPNAIPTTVVYSKKSGFTPPTSQKLKQQAAQLQQMDDVEGKVIGPIPSEDMQAAQTVVTFNVGSDGWNKMPGIGKKIHKIAGIDGGTVYSPAAAARPSTPPSRSPAGQQPAARGAAGGDPPAAPHLPQPGALGPADLLGGRRAGHSLGLIYFLAKDVT